MATVLLVRHGETTWNRERRVQGWAPASLTDRGREQARAVAAHLADRDVDRVVASDLRRTKETARVVARAVDAPVTFDRGWRERSFGVYQGLTYEALFDGHPEFALREVGHHAATVEPEAGESLLAARDRVLDAWERLVADLASAEGGSGDAAASDGETVAVVTHGGPIRLVLGALQGLDVVEAILRADVANCSITEVRVDDDGPALVEECLVVQEAPAADRDGRGTY